LEIDPIAYPFNLGVKGLNLELESEAIAAETPNSLVAKDPLVSLMSGGVLGIMQRHRVARCSPDGQLFLALRISTVFLHRGPVRTHGQFRRSHAGEFACRVNYL